MQVQIPQRQQVNQRHMVRWVTLAALMMSVLGIFAWSASARAQEQDEETPTSQTAPGTVNVELILDASGSMAGPVVEGEDLTRIDAAKQVLNDVIEAIPEREGINVGFRVYGHLGTNTEAGRAESCQSTELQVPIEGVNKEALRQQVEAFEPVGWTPIALSLREAADDFPDAAEGVTNAVVLVTDGLETCGGDPCTASRALKQGAVGVTTHVIGFALLEEEQQNLQCIVDESGGLLLGAGSAEELREALFQVLEEVEVVVRNGFLEIESIGGLFPRATIEGQAGATDAAPEGEPFTTTLTDQNRIELPAGTYAVFWANPSGQETRLQVEIIAEETTFIRGSIIRFPHGAGEEYTLRDQAGIVLWQGQIEEGDLIWVLPGIYRLDLAELTGDPILISMVVQTHPGQVTKIDVMTTP